MELIIRKLVNFDEEILVEGGRAATPPPRLLAVAALVQNPWAARGYVEDLRPEIRSLAPVLGKLLTERIVAPAADELIAAFGGSTGGRPDHRIDDRYQDLADIGADVANPANLPR